ncbi:MAG: NPCBM/NEW2 domain-containing protein [Planctomycetaceae bacterium]|nr:NPCBM/NEW2 domain-containing protein [Planctomycetaceae bacterium]
MYLSYFKSPKSIAKIGLVFAFLFFGLELVMAEEVYIDQLDLSKTTCGWRDTLARKSVGGNQLSIAGVKFERGVGHHAPGEIIVALPQTDGFFSAKVGIDDEVGKKGHAKFIVYIDGKMVWQSGFMVGSQKAEFCKIPFKKTDRQLCLTVDTGEEGYDNDHTDWADAKIEFQIDPNSDQKIIETTKKRIIIGEVDENSREYLYLSRELKTGISAKRASQALRSESTFLASDRDPVDVVLRRTGAMFNHLKKLPNTPSFETEQQEFDKLQKEINETAVSDINLRKELFKRVTGLRDRIALRNPLIDFKNILFIKRHYTPEPEKQGNHMVDQFFGFHATSGGGLFILEDAFVPEKRKVKNLLEGSAVANDKRLKGVRLDASWGYLAPELSFDGTKLLFAAADTSEKRHSYSWTEGNCYHLFEVNIDGTKLTQLTDGAWNDIDPCYLPNGRIVFISERRGGYGRCHGRACPSYTLHSMLSDGSDITVLSPHETNEWAPMVDHNGMIIYTRWDYVDRGFNQAHHPWITYPDGRDPRAIQGNYSEVEESRPHFEDSFRPIPNSHKLLGIAHGHHTQYFGSVIILDPNIPDDEEGGDAMAPIRRITPEQPFPEIENHAHRDASNYGQPFPINEDFYLVVYDPFSSMKKGHANNFGIYLIDSFGNKTLLYRDLDISCQSPIAVKSRPVPPIIPHQTLVGLPAGATLPNADSNSGKIERLPDSAVVGVINMYETNRPFPQGTQIKELRVVQILPKTTAYNNLPRIGYGDETGARKVLGTVPVDVDGSCRFDLPVNVPVYFQALNAEGVAVQTMRSATYVKPGEMLTCLGCHEGRQRGTAKPTVFPTAFRREPSQIKPEMEGSNPFSFPKLVQPILDKHCVSCHEKEKDAGKTFALGRKLARGPKAEGRKEKFYESYVNLEPYVYLIRNVKTRGKSLNSWSPSRTFPGQFGTNKSTLWKLLKDGHYEVSLSSAEYRALALWMDNNADFYGAFELDSITPQLNGKQFKPTLE